MQTIEVITSAFNEEVCLRELHKRIQNVVKRESKYSWRVTFIDNGSTDSTWSIISEIASGNLHINGIRMSRNFSLDAAFTCGMDRAVGDAVVIMCSDLQDPPELISEFLRQYELGFDQVVARIKSRPDLPLLRRIASRVFYKLANRLTRDRIPQNVSDYRLMSKTCYMAVRQLREQHRFLRGLTAWVGFKTSYIDIDRAPRFGGESKFLKQRFSQIFQWAFQGILSHTTAPLVWISGLGLLFSFLSLLCLIIFVGIWLTVGVPFAGFLSIIASISLGFSINVLFLGVMSQYLGLVVEEVKNRPLYVVAEYI